MTLPGLEKPLHRRQFNLRCPSAERSQQLHRSNQDILSALETDDADLATGQQASARPVTPKPAAV